MLNLMKYEFRRQLFSKIVIFGGLIAFVIAFFIFYMQGNEIGVIFTLAFMGLGTMMVVFFAPIELWFPFDKDVYSKHGYMLFLLPKKSTTILGAKVLLSFLQTVVIYALFFTVVPFCERLAASRYEAVPEFVGGIVEAFGETFLPANANAVQMIGTGINLIVTVLFFSILGLFITAIPLQMGKFVGGVVGVGGYLVAFALITFVSGKIEELLFLLHASQAIIEVFDLVYMVGIDIALFLGTAKLLDEKVSI